MTDTITKMYQNLTDTERGKLAWHYMTKGDDLERARIDSTMTEQYFTGLPLEYRRTVNNLSDLSFWYAVTYWQKVAHCLAAMSATATMLHSDDENKDAYKPYMALFEQQEGRLLAIEVALEDVCRGHGLDADAMRFCVQGKFYSVATPDLLPDVDYRNTMREFFEDALR